MSAPRDLRLPGARRAFRVGVARRNRGAVPRALALVALPALLALVALPARGHDPAQDPPGPAPRFVLEVGTHTGRVDDIAADREGRFVVTGADDGTARVWEARTGRLLETYRPGDPGQAVVAGVAISPDGGLVAVSTRPRDEGDGADALWLFDRHGEELRWTAGGLDRLVDFAFLPDGGSLVLALRKRVASEVRVVGARDGALRASREADVCHALALDVAEGEWIALACESGSVQLLASPSLVPRCRSKSFGGLAAVRFRPGARGRALAAAGIPARRSSSLPQDLAAVTPRELHILSGSSCEAYHTRPLALPAGCPWSRVAWDAAGGCVVTAGESCSSLAVTNWSVGGDRCRTTSPAARGVAALASLPDGLAYAGVDGTWGVLDSGGQERFARLPAILDWGAQRGLQADRFLSGAVRFAYGAGEVPAEFRPEKLALDLAPPASSGLTPLGAKVKGIRGSSDPPRLAVETAKHRWTVATPAAVRTAGFAYLDQLVVAALADGTIRWYTTDEGRELLAYFPHPDRRRWVAWTPSGTYATSPEGETLFGWQIDRGPDRVPEWAPAERFRERFHHPGLVSRILWLRDEQKAAQEPVVNLGENVFVKGARVEETLPQPAPAGPLPVLTLVAPGADVETAAPEVELRVAVRSPSGEPVTAVRAYVDGRAVAATRGVAFEPDSPAGTAPSAPPADPKAERIYALTVPVPPREATVVVKAETAAADSAPVLVRVRRPARAPEPAKPNLYLLAVGVGAYANPALRLDFPAKDARDVAAAWKAQEGRLYGKVEARVLADPAKDAILSGLEWLETATTANDVAVLFFAGHGINDPRTGEYLFLPREADLAARRVTLLSHRDVESVFASIPGKVLFFLDTCHSGNLLGGRTRDAADPTRLLDELKGAGRGVVLFAATTRDGRAQEDARLGNGAFTKALVEALQGKADGDGDGSVWVSEVETYLGKRVRELTGGLQAPTTAKPASLPDFPVAVVAAPAAR